jgi:SAM-dependent methyltransferase
MVTAVPHVVADPGAERHRLLQSQVWESAGRALVADLDLPPGARVLDVGCGGLGWLRVLADCVPDGVVVGTDADRELLCLADEACERAGYDHVRLVADDLFRSALPAGLFDLVHARFMLGSLGRAAAQVAAYRRLLKPGGILVLEEADSRTWTFEPYAPATATLIGRLLQAFRVAGGDFDAGRRLDGLLRRAGARPSTRTHVLGLEAGHPYLQLPLRLGATLDDEHRGLVGMAAEELADPARRGTTFTLVQSWARMPDGPAHYGR